MRQSAWPPASRCADLATLTWQAFAVWVGTERLPSWPLDCSADLQHEQQEQGAPVCHSKDPGAAATGTPLVICSLTLPGIAWNCATSWHSATPLPCTTGRVGRAGWGTRLGLAPAGKHGSSGHLPAA